MSNNKQVKLTSKIINPRQDLLSLNLEKIIPGAKIVDSLEINETQSNASEFILSNQVKDCKISLNSGMIKSQNITIKNNVGRTVLPVSHSSNKIIMKNRHKSTNNTHGFYYKTRDKILDQLKHDIVQRNIIQYLKEYRL